MTEDRQDPLVQEPEVEAIPVPEGDTEIIETDYDIGQDNFSGAISMDLDIHKIVFSVSAIGIMLFTFLTLAFQNDAEPLFVALRDWLTGNLDWFFLLSGNIFVVVCLGLILSPLGVDCH
ncbi:MAG: BCCT family transporter [Paracoccaceae bacterium]